MEKPGLVSDDCIQIANEFTTVHIRKVRTRNGERLEIESKKNGLKVYLDPMQLEALTLSGPEIYSKMIQQNLEGGSKQYGPTQSAAL